MVTYDLYLAAMHYSVWYLIIIVLALVFGTFGKTTRKNRRAFLFCVLTIMFVLMAFRNVNMGSDTKRYVVMFDRIKESTNPFDYISNSSVESGYVLYCWLLSRIVPNARILFVVSAFIIVFSIGRFADKHIDNLGVFFSLFVGTLLFDSFLSLARNALSIAVFLFAVDALIERKPWKYYLLCLLAFSFHNTAVIYFIIYPICSPQLLKKHYTLILNIFMIGIAFVCGILFQPMLEMFFNMFPKYQYYIGTANLDGKTRVAGLLQIAVCILLIVVPKVVYKYPAHDWRLDGFGRKMAMFNLLVMVVAISATAFMRIAIVLNIYTLMQFSNEVGRMKRGSTNKLLLIPCALAAFFLYGLVVVVFRTPEWQTTYPINLSWAL